MVAVGESLFQSPGPADPGGRDDEGVGGTAALAEEVQQALRDLVRRGGGPRRGRAVGRRARVDDDHADAAARERVAERGGVEGVDPGVLGREAGVGVGRELGQRPHDPASQRSTAAR